MIAHDNHVCIVVRNVADQGIHETEQSAAQVKCKAES